MQQRTVIPYEGTKPYVFVSYAHRDSRLVMPVLEKLHSLGYRIWFDDGIAPGSEWPENIAQHLNDCALTMAFVSPNSIASDNCRREVTFALSKRKPFLGVILQKTDMSLGMEMQLSAQQCVMKYAYSSEEDFIQKLCTCPDLEPCLGTPPVQEAVPEDEAVTKRVVTDSSDESGERARRKPEKAKREKPLRRKEKRTREPGAGKKVKKILAVTCAGIAALALVCILVNAVTRVKLTDTKTVRTGDTYLNLSNETVTVEMAGKIGRLGKLKTVSFRYCSFQPGALEALELPEQLKEFYAVECSGVDGLTFLQELPNLTGLTLENCGISDAMLPEVTLNSLRRLNLANNSGFTDLSKIATFQALTELDIAGTGVKTLEGLDIPGLTKINFTNTKIADVTPLTRMEGLTSIQGSRTPVSDINALAALEKLTVLNFNDCRIKAVDDSFKALRLSQLWLENNGLTSLDAFADCAVLTKVGLADNALTDVSVLEKSAETLTYLSLSGNDLLRGDVEFLSAAVHLKELYLDGIPMNILHLSDEGNPAMTGGPANIDFVENMPELEKLSAVGCNISEMPELSGCTKLAYLRLADNDLSDISSLQNLSTTMILTLDLSYNVFEDLSGLPDVRYGVLALYGDCADLKTLPDVSGRTLGITYKDELESTRIADKTFSNYWILNCPAGQKVKTEELLGSYRIRFLESEEDLISQMDKEGLDYSFLKNLETTEE